MTGEPLSMILRIQLLEKTPLLEKQRIIERDGDPQHFSKEATQRLPSLRLDQSGPKGTTGFTGREKPQSAAAASDSEKILLYVTVPQKISSNESEESEKHVIYDITMDGKSYTLHLEKHSLLPQNFFVYTNGETGTLHSESSYLKMNCHYRGYVADFPNSVVTLNICSGLRGFLQFENITIGIEPIGSCAGFKHIIYQVKNNSLEIPVLTESGSNAQHKDQPLEGHMNSQRNLFSKQFPHHLEIYIIVEKTLYDYMGSGMMTVTQKIVQVIGLVNTMFTQLKLNVILSSLELWSEKNYISTSGDADDILQRFLAWKQDNFVPRPHDMAYLLIYSNYPKHVGATFPGMICNKSYDVGIAMYPDSISLEGFAVIITQLLGLNLGLTYDDMKKCVCPRATCIMNHEAPYSSGIKMFSNCSMYDYTHFVSKFEPKCLQEISHLQLLYENQPVCGNGILEPNEECDCGNEEECQFEKCCDYSICKLKGSVQCGSGACCTSECELAVAGTPCRKSVDEECDFTEYCNGTSSNCVPDTYALNGHMCKLGTAYCYNGRCQTTDTQCVEAFGKGAKAAPFACFEEVNPLHDGSGNCSSKDLRSLPCEQKDVLCGKLACIWSHENANKNDNPTTVYSYVQGHVCMSTVIGSSVSSDGRDYAYVADGTACGPQMYCLNKTCQEVSLIEYDCNPNIKCKGNGVCNNLGNCHCFPGYKPPDCVFHIGSPGGSIDDGNAQKSDIYIIKKNNSTHENWFILSFYIFLPFFITFIIIVFKQNEMTKIMDRKEEIYER
ncbi:PREDICTED: disintegrin and metalloproteinase domain-containing protein 18-like [Elephantulus edwardii]|uniref:disintegrin and metalloproteinase domain-containing protein 18-like n=1 Tax=Elephantulus edwardii TaxID=28737 RepID=UPI0003F0DF63|nr:PREDICTED: disintegrin and metalloproteinase domain-containing protein 18-like [Elephantulus edwardii]